MKDLVKMHVFFDGDEQVKAGKEPIGVTFVTHKNNINYIWDDTVFFKDSFVDSDGEPFGHAYLLGGGIKDLDGKGYGLGW